MFDDPSEIIPFEQSKPFADGYRVVHHSSLACEEAEMSSVLVSPEDMAVMVKNFGPTARVAVPENDNWITVAMWIKVCILTVARELLLWARETCTGDG